MKLLPPGSPPVVPRPAATTLVVRDGERGLEVLMVRRSLQASFMPGAYVFPGGAVDDADGSPEHAARCDESAAQLQQRIGKVTQVGGQAQAYAVAALRECFEECGLWLGLGSGTSLGRRLTDRQAADRAAEQAVNWPLWREALHRGTALAQISAQAGLPLATSGLQPWSRWVTPVGVAKRFDTLFFVAAAPEHQRPEVDANETTALAWVHPPQALAAHAEGSFAMEFATVTTLQSLVPFASLGQAALLAHAAAHRSLPAIHPRIQRAGDGRALRVLLPGEMGYDEAALPPA